VGRTRAANAPERLRPIDAGPGQRIRQARLSRGLSQKQLADRVGTTQSVIARLEDAQYTGQSLRMLERIATACGVNLKLRAEKKPGFDREVVLA